MGKRKRVQPPSESESESEDGTTDSSDEELQEAFKKGQLKPGLNIVKDKPKEFKNDVKGLNSKLEEIKLKLPWVESLVLLSSPAPLAPELAVQIQEQEVLREKQLKGNKKLPQFKPSEDPVLNDFKRETMFYRQAQSTVIEGIARLKSLNVPTKRPDDYYAEMVKSDDHMKKVKDNLLKKQAEAQRSEKVRQLRQQRKVQKQMQVESTLKKHAEKRKLMEEVKKYQKGYRKDLDFLHDNAKSAPKGQNNKHTNKRALQKKNMKDAKFGFGGKKRGSKQNTRESASDISEYRRPEKPGRKGKGKSKLNAAKIRPGKNRRIKMKARKKS